MMVKYKVAAAVILIFLILWNVSSSTVEYLNPGRNRQQIITARKSKKGEKKSKFIKRSGGGPPGYLFTGTRPKTTTKAPPTPPTTPPTEATPTPDELAHNASLAVAHHFNEQYNKLQEEYTKATTVADQTRILLWQKNLLLHQYDRGKPI